ncbi:MAG: response regulator transcription factor [Phenylobacterium sp.]|uniref:LytTR family transcriptional regulator DNA-binding domain-containing protein n=1 Tax=Phenylobacterium sp. TaxID=1871053 RepID=UPI001A5B2ED2|nr:LytTR family DNA-binding domain-containing protein [Phenylobacterium sp.]MBL8554943.1 response regulator transcription factor [Phenylobacterium sp.]
MWRAVLVAMLATAWATAAQAARVGPWELCAGTGPAGLHDCRPVAGPREVDPQGRERWMRAPVGPRGPNDATPTLLVAGAMSTEAWFNGVRIGANGRPGATAAEEHPGLYQAAIPIDPSLWRGDGRNELVVRMSAHHAGLRFAHPVGGVWIGRYAYPLGMLALTFGAAGALAAAAFGFGAVYAMRRTGSSLMLAALSGVAAAQALVENLRNLVAYPYPLHAWRVGAIWMLAAAFALLLVAYAAVRFAPRRRNLLLAVAVPSVAASLLHAGFDQRTGWALVAGVAVAGAAAAIGVRAGRPGAAPVLAYLALFAAVAAISPSWLLDLNFFLLAATLLIPLLVAEVVRVSRDDRARETALARAAGRPDRLTVATARGVELTPLGDIVAILGADDYAELRLAGGRSLLHDARLEQLSAELPSGFVRVHRSAIANLAHAERLERDGARWRLHMSEGAALPVSRSRLAALRDALDPPQVAARTSAR